MNLSDLKAHRSALDSAVRKGWAQLCSAVTALSSGEGERAQAQRNAVLAFTVRVASAAILFLSQVAIARWMGGHDYGIYVYAWTWVLVLGGLSSLGLNVAGIRMVSQYRETGDTALLRGFLSGTRLLTFAVAVVVASFIAFSLWALPMRGMKYWPLLVAMLAVPAYALSDIQDAIFRGNARMLSATVPPYILRPLLMLAGIWVIHIMGWPLTPGSAVMAAVIACWITWAVQTWMISTQVTAPIPAGPKTMKFREWLTISLPLMAICACELALQNTDVIVISHLLSPTDAGIYFAAAKTMGLIMFVYYAVGSAMANRYAAIHARGDKTEMEAIVRDGVRWTFWPSVGMGCLMLLAGRPILRLFGPEFDCGYPVMMILVAAFLVRASIGPVDFLLNMTGGQMACARSLAIAAVLNLVLNLILVPQFGILGAACAVSLSLIAGAALNYRVACKQLGFDIGIWAPLLQRKTA